MAWPNLTIHNLTHWAETLLNLGSAFAGILGTYLISKRYAGTFISGMRRAFGGPFRYWFGNRQLFLEYLVTKERVNRDVPDAIADMFLGLSLLFWAFFLQLVSILVATFTKA